ncbi:MAG: hypothetical protein HFI34_12250 [Lachnospiraceae bacterium]|nr:hypothetical protein [Lachnospiraceae bacterium]
MAICPKCKLEYEDGITLCTDCNCPLTDKLPDFELSVPIYYDKNEEYISKLTEYLKYSKINAVAQHYDEEKESFCIYTDATHEQSVKRLLNIYFDNELKEEAANTPEAEFPSSAPLEEAPANYVKKADKYKDLRGSALTLILAGLLGDIYLIRKSMGMIPFGPDYSGITNILFLIVMGTLFNVFLIGGILAYKKSNTIKGEIDAEEQLTAGILSEFTVKTADELDSNYEKSENEGTLYFNRTDYLKKQITAKYGNLDEAYLEDLIEQIYQAVFEA